MSIASSFDTDTSDLEPPDSIPMQRRPTVVLAAPSSDWDPRSGGGGGGGGKPLIRKKSRKCYHDEDEDEEEGGRSSPKNNSFKSDWSNTRTHQNFLVDSIEIERKVKGSSVSGGGAAAYNDDDYKDDDYKDDDYKNASTRKNQQPSQQLSPYLSLPKQPPTMTLVQEGEFLFQEIDRDGDGVVSKIDIIKALRVNSPLAKVSKAAAAYHALDSLLHSTHALRCV